ncbi:MAG: hypothetical protein AB1898_23640 [Acidobacteriota bacterium]
MKPTLEILEAKLERVLVRLANRTGHPIYLANELLQSQDKYFVVHHLERRVEGTSKFQFIRNPIHFAPRVAPVGNGQVLVFSLLKIPEEPGEYRVTVSYLVSEEAYQLTRQPGLLNRTQKKRLYGAYKKLKSNSFFVRKGKAGNLSVDLRSESPGSKAGGKPSGESLH